jgi:hypothetical protein
MSMQDDIAAMKGKPIGYAFRDGRMVVRWPYADGSVDAGLQLGVVFESMLEDADLVLHIRGVEACFEFRTPILHDEVTS